MKRNGLRQFPVSLVLPRWRTLGQWCFTWRSLIAPQLPTFLRPCCALPRPGRLLTAKAGGHPKRTYGTCMTDLSWPAFKVLETLSDGPLPTRFMADWAVFEAREAGLVRQMHTLYGPVSLLTPRGEQVYGVEHPVRLAGPDAVTDRAYQNTARMMMEYQGYRVHGYRYKRHGKGSAVQGRRHSDVIVHTILQVPDERYKALVEGYGDKYRDMDFDVLGRPYLMATIANGGLRSQRFRRLVEKHLGHTRAWHHPLILAVPDLERHAGDLAYLSRTQRRSVHELVRLIHLPLPGTSA